MLVKYKQINIQLSIRKLSKYRDNIYICIDVNRYPWIQIIMSIFPMAI